MHSISLASPRMSVMAVSHAPFVELNGPSCPGIQPHFAHRVILFSVFLMIPSPHFASIVAPSCSPVVMMMMTLLSWTIHLLMILASLSMYIRPHQASVLQFRGVVAPLVMYAPTTTFGHHFVSNSSVEAPLPHCNHQPGKHHVQATLGTVRDITFQ